MLECPICNKILKQINNKHVKTHNISIQEFRVMFPNFQTSCNDTKIKISNATKKVWEKFKNNDTIFEKRIKLMTKNNSSDSRKASISKKLQQNWKNDEYRNNNINGQINSIKSNNMIRKNTSIELKVKDQLDFNHIKYKTQKNIYNKELKIRAICDFYLIDYNLVIECNGDYWHCNPKVYKTGPINQTQQNRIKKDKLKIKLYKFLNINYIIIWESDIKKENFNILNYINI